MSQSSTGSSGIVITNGPDGTADDTGEQAEPDVQDEANVQEPDSAEEEQPDPAPAESEAEQEADSEPEVDAAAEPDYDSESETDDSSTVEENANTNDSGESGKSGENNTSQAEQPEAEAMPTEAEASAETAAEVEPEAEPEPEAELEAEPEVDSEVESEVDNSDRDVVEEPASEIESQAETEQEEPTEDADADAGVDSTDQTQAVDLMDVDHAPGQFEAAIDGGTIKSTISSVDVLVDECKIRVAEDRMVIRAVDPANVGMVDLTLEAEAFESFIATPGVMGVDLSRFKKVISLAKSNSRVHLVYDEATRKLSIEVDNVEYTLSMIDPQSIRQEPEIPNLEVPVTVEVETREINRGLKAADMVADHVTFRTNSEGRENQFIIEAEGDTDDVDLTINESDDGFVSGRFSGDGNSLFDLGYLKNIKKALPASGTATLEIGENFPVKIHFEDYDGAMNVTYMLAPRIQS